MTTRTLVGIDPAGDVQEPAMCDSMIVVGSETLGRGDDALGHRLMLKFLTQLATQDTKPSLVAFLNSGVRLLARGSDAVPMLVSLEKDGTDIVACGTCVEHYEMLDSLAIGRVTDMREIVGSMNSCAKVVTI
jgi:selenium metabolism protein YedF